MPAASEGSRIPLQSPTDEHLAEWSDVLNAVPLRLRQIVGQRLVTESGLPVSDARAEIQIGVLECASAINLLNEALLRELRHCHRLEQVTVPPQAALAQARPEPSDGPAGKRVARLLTPRASREHQTPMAQRRLFRQQLEQVLAADGQAATPLALLAIDLDGFGPIAEIHGPDVGDRVLQITAARLSRTVRSSDVISRIGFQAFGCLVVGAMDRQQLGQVAGKMVDAMAAPVRVGTLWLHVNPSVGIAHGAASATGAAGMLAGACSAMLQARQQHSAYAFFEPPSRRPAPGAGAVAASACVADSEGRAT
ncbi:MAG TPA: GGDEF domain-containing protein [Ideonella sp.]|uniref:GGDEF domain-containing protein n=1 Tax=Ideonella sp. TaxID=1929293 RepID=UPI002E31A5CD|nr:GGDEF domain-containing protein [Ideonella sp.]HEX5685889.1 GGDEF domain-containing protein [Ideonella sp.]